MSKVPAIEFHPDGWFTERAYSSERFASLPKGSGIYVLVDIDITDRPFRYAVLYAGMSKNLSRRFKSHAIYQDLCKTFDIFVFFKPCERSELRKKEKDIIQCFNPPYNLQLRMRGV